MKIISGEFRKNLLTKREKYVYKFTILEKSLKQPSSEFLIPTSWILHDTLNNERPPRLFPQLHLTR